MGLLADNVGVVAAVVGEVGAVTAVVVGGVACSSVRAAGARMMTDSSSAGVGIEVDSEVISLEAEFTSAKGEAGVSSSVDMAYSVIGGQAVEGIGTLSFGNEPVLQLTSETSLFNFFYASLL